MRNLLSVPAIILAMASVSHAAIPSRQSVSPDDPQRDPGWKLGHTRSVSDVAYSADGKYIASTSYDGSIRLWNARSGALVKTLASTSEGGGGVQFSPDSASLAGTSRKHQIGIWSVPQGRLRYTFSVLDGGGGFAWSPDGTVLANGVSQGQILVWHPATGAHRMLKVPSIAVDAIAFSPNGKRLMVGGRGDGTVVALCDVRTGQRLRNWLTRKRVEGVEFAPNGRLVVVTETDGRATLRDTANGHVRQTIRAKEPQSLRFYFSPRGTTLLVASYPSGLTTAQVWDLAHPGRKAKTLDLDGKEVKAISPDGRRFVATDPRQENRVRLCDSHSGRELWASADPSLILGSKPGLALLEQLRADYRAYGLPPLPPSAYLAYVGPRNGLPPGTEDRYLTFVLPPARDGDKALYFRGLDDWKVREEQTVRAVTPEQATLKNTQTPRSRRSPFQNDMITAIQVQERGATPLAMEFLKRALKDYRSDARHDFAVGAWKYWEQTLVQSDTDRRNALNWMRRLAQTDFLQKDAAKHRLVADLDSTLATRKASPGSIDAAIDALVDYHVQGANFPSGTSSQTELSEADPRYRKLWLLGFDAVPTLLKHTNDRRLTRTYFDGINMSPPYIVRIQTVVAYLLIGLAGSSEALGLHWPNEWIGPCVENAQAERWWEQARATGEEHYLLTHLLPKKDSINASPNTHNAVLIALKYPRYLPELYREALDRYPHAQNWDLAQLLQRSSLPDADKVPLFVRAATTGGDQQRLAAFWQLISMKRPETARMLVERIDSLPPRLPLECGWPLVAQALDDSRTWEALERLTRRSSVEQRMAIVDSIGDRSMDAERKRHQIVFLAKFVQDTIPPVTAGQKPVGSRSGGGKIADPERGFDRNLTTVEDVALKRLAYMLDINEYPDATWTQETWARWRDTTLQALHSYLARP